MEKEGWRIVSPFIIAGDIGRGIVRLPLTTAYQGQNYVRGLPSRHELVTDEINNWYVDNINKDQPKSIKISDVYGPNFTGGKNSNLKKVLADLPSIWQLPFKLITNAGIDGGGKGAWETMVRRTQTMFNSPEEFEENPQLSVSNAEREKAIEEASKRVIPRSTGALSKCMEKLRPILEVPNGYKGYEVVLIGHSMGTIVMNEILHRYSTFSFNHIVYMGAACSINDFRVNGIPSLIKHNETNFYNLCLHPLAEQRERQGKGFIPRGSLLEWLDNFLTSPNTTLDRRMGKWENIVRTTSVIPNEVRRRVTLKAFELCKSKGNSQKADECKGCHRNPSQKPPKNTGNPQGHGEFTEQNFWEKDFWKP
ncbi:MAG: hypothetical protein E3K40_06260 [Candidatus Brocadia sp.]|nr:hypothetical protein [Candidatus Brocadia sp.]